jgi:phosphoribosyl 1,2-cyclic phosphodiesterase
MKLEFWGVRGTMPISGIDRVKYGGNTICSAVYAEDKIPIIIDAGTGIKKLGDEIVREKGDKPLNLSILLTHFHLDHIQGLPFFAPLYLPDAVITFYSPQSPKEMEQYLSGLMSGRYFPVDFWGTPSMKLYLQIQGDFCLKGVHISMCPLHHPQGSVAYRLATDNRTVVFATDTEHPSHGIDERLAAFAEGADDFIYDATFTLDEYESGKSGWGHSTWLEGTKLAEEAKVKHLFLHHFNPDHSDEHIDEIVAKAREKFPRTSGAKESS